MVQVAHSVGALQTLGLLFASAMLGSWFAKREGMRVIAEMEAAAREHRIAEANILDGLLVLAGGALMIAPGFLSDAAGLFLLIPPTRRVAAGLLRRWFEKKI